MTTHFRPDFFSNNRAKLRASLGGDEPIVVTGNGAMQQGADEPSPFHQDSSFYYLTGLNGADLTLVMTATETYLLVPALSFVREAFDGAHDPAAYTERSGITTILDAKEGWAKIRSELQRTRKVATLGSPAEHLPYHGIYTLPFRRRLITKLKRVVPGVEIHDIRVQLASLRCIKQPEELQAIQHAIDITCETLCDIIKPDVLQVARHEYELEAFLSYGFRSRGATGHAFTPIVGAGKHTTTLHHVENNGPIKPTDLIVLDVGADVEHYAADITRTICQQPMGKRQLEVFEAVATVQDFALRQIRPGVLPSDYEKAVETFMGEQLMQLGVIKETTRENIRHYFPHATSHFLGLDTHDVGDYRAPWEEGMVIACEPGIYIPEEGIGVRIEDDILITANGYKNLSAACPRALGQVQ